MTNRQKFAALSVERRVMPKLNWSQAVNIHKLLMSGLSPLLIMRLHLIGVGLYDITIIM